MPALLLNHRYPYFSIYVPVDASWRQFQGGKLEIDEEDDAYEIVLEVARIDPNIEIQHTEASTAEAPAGKSKPARRVKAQAEHSCDACRPAQVFDTAEELQEHLKVVHMALPKMDAEGNEIGRRGETEAETSIPAATPKK